MTSLEVRELLGCSARTVTSYTKDGRLNPTKKNGKLIFIRDEVMKIATETHKKLKRHDPTKNQTKEPDKIQNTEIKTIDHSKLLNETGESELLRVSGMLKEIGLFEVTDSMLLLKYALNQQRYLFYYVEAETEPGYVKLMEYYQKEAKFYEKELMITTASRVKLMPKKEEKTLDPMEALLNG